MRTVVNLCTLGVFCFSGELGFLNCDDICMCVVNKQLEFLEFDFDSVPAFTIPMTCMNEQMIYNYVKNDQNLVIQVRKYLYKDAYFSFCTNHRI